GVAEWPTFRKTSLYSCRLVTSRTQRGRCPTGRAGVPALGEATACDRGGGSEKPRRHLREETAPAVGHETGARSHVRSPLSCPAVSRPWAIVGWRLARFERAEIGRLAREAVRHVGQRHTAVDCSRARFEPEVEVFRFVELLNVLTILRVELLNIDEGVVIHTDAVLVLPRRLCILRKRRKPPHFQ